MTKYSLTFLLTSAVLPVHWTCLAHQFGAMMTSMTLILLPRLIRCYFFIHYSALWKTLNVNFYKHVAVWKVARSLIYCIWFPWWKHGPITSIWWWAMSSPWENIMLLCVWKILVPFLFTLWFIGRRVLFSVCTVLLP